MKKNTGEKASLCVKKSQRKEKKYLSYIITGKYIELNILETHYIHLGKTLVNAQTCTEIALFCYLENLQICAKMPFLHKSHDS